MWCTVNIIVLYFNCILFEYSLNMQSESEYCHVPRRCGLITWAVLKICVALFTISYIFVGAYYMYIRPGCSFNTFALAMVVSEALLILDISMSMLLIIGEWKKSYGLVTAYFRYAILAIVTTIIVILAYTAYELGLIWIHSENTPLQNFKRYSLSGVVKLATVGTVYILIEVYFIYLLMKELFTLRYHWQLKLKNDLSALSVAESFVETPY